MLNRITIAAVLILAAAVGISAQQGRPGNLSVGGVYVMTNQTDNAVMAFARNPGNGRLRLVDTESTRGAGDPVPIPPDPPIDPLASQGSLAIDEDNEYLYAVNAGSNDITTLEITRRGLEFVGKVPSGGIRPISIAVHNEVLYVLNEGGTPNITGFDVAEDGSLTPIPGSMQMLIGTGLDPAQVGFNGDGTFLFVTEKAGNTISAFPVDELGVAGQPVQSPSNGVTPFGFTFDPNGHLIVAEAGNANISGAASSYAIGNDGTLRLITGSLGNGQIDVCWIAASGRNIYTSSPASNTIAAYTSDNDGHLNLVSEVAADTGEGSAPIDMAISRHGRRFARQDGFLYVIEAGAHTIGVFRINIRGRLTHVGDFGELPAGAQGIIAI